MTSKIIGDEALRRKLRSISNLRFLRPTMKSIGISISGVLKVYPPPPPGSTYRRTGDLRKHWTSKVFSNTAVSISNAIPYAPYVQDPELQAWIHVGRWKTTDEAADEKSEDALKEVQKAVDRELAKG